ncbi:MAG: sporulation integral membrane protein YtvI [Clostridia bacterium]|nr:sporulation integral membrane protein YtvI [Clostridia bacterium]
MKTETLVRFAAGAVCAAAAAAAVWLAVRYALGILLPFLLAFLLAIPVRAAADWFERKTGFHSAAGRLLLLLALTALTVILVVRCGGRIVDEAGEFAENAAAYLASPDNLLRQAADKLDEVVSRILPRSGGIGGAVYDAFSSFFSAVLGEITSAAATRAGNVIGALPGFLLSLFTGLVALFYFTLDYERVRWIFARFVPVSRRESVSRFRAAVQTAAAGYAKAYGLIFLITFAEVLLGLTVLRCRYAILLSLLIAAVDILPVLGVGTVLVPWSAVCFLADDYKRGIGLLVLFAVTTVVREFIEPKLLGKCIGLHPLAALFAVYAGFRLAGIAGMILFPVGIYFLRALIAEPETQ